MVIEKNQTRFATISRTLTDSGTGYGSLRKTLFVAQVTVVTALVYLSVLVATSYAKVSSSRLGFDPSGLWALSLPSLEYPSNAAQLQARQLLGQHQQRVDSTLAALSLHPEVVSVATSSVWPMREQGIVPAVVRAERDPHSQLIDGRNVFVSEGFMRTLGATLLAGSELSDAEAATISESAAVEGNAYALVNATLARHLQQFGPPVGQFIIVAPSRRIKVLGVVADIRLARPDEAPVATVFSFFKSRSVGYHVMVRARDDRVSLAPVLRDTAARIWGLRSTGELVRVLDAIHDANSGYRARATVIALIAMCSLPIAALGLLGAVAHECSERRHEFAVRLALGSTPMNLRAVLVRRFAAQAALGLTAGVAIGVGAGRSMEAMLFGVSSADLWTVVGVLAMMAFVLGVAIVVPSRHVATADALSSLRQ